MNNKEVIVVKIGGSVIYDKNRVRYELIYDLLHRIYHHHRGKKLLCLDVAINFINTFTITT